MDYWGGWDWCVMCGKFAWMTRVRQCNACLTPPPPKTDICICGSPTLSASGFCDTCRPAWTATPKPPTLSPCDEF